MMQDTKQLYEILKEKLLAKRSDIEIVNDRSIDVALKSKVNFAFIHFDEKFLKIDVILEIGLASGLNIKIKMSEKKSLRRSFMKSGITIFIHNEENIADAVEILLLAKEKADQGSR